jgi:hypothetical protein
MFSKSYTRKRPSKSHRCHCTNFGLIRKLRVSRQLDLVIWTCYNLDLVIWTCYNLDLVICTCNNLDVCNAISLCCYRL